MRGDMLPLPARSLAATLDHVPHDILRDAFPPYLSGSGDGAKDPSLRDPSRYCPLIERCFDPWISSNSRPTSSDLRKTTTKQQGQHGVVALRSHAISTSTLEYFRTLLCAQPVARAKPELLDSFHSADARSQLGTEQA